MKLEKVIYDYNVYTDDVDVIMVFDDGYKLRVDLMPSQWEDFLYRLKKTKPGVEVVKAIDAVTP